MVRKKTAIKFQIDLKKSVAVLSLHNDRFDFTTPATGATRINQIVTTNRKLFSVYILHHLLVKR